eukprot:EG_transcript_14287
MAAAQRVQLGAVGAVLLLLTYLLIKPRPEECGAPVDSVQVVARLRAELSAVKAQLAAAETALQARHRDGGTGPASLARRGGEGRNPTCLRPKYHVSAMLSANGVGCQDHDKFLKGHVDPVVVECGAASGHEAAHLSQVARVYSFEANPANMPGIERIIKERGNPANLRVKHAACGNVSGTIDLFIPQGARHSQTASLASQKWWSGSTEKVTVPIVRLSDEIREHVTLLKLDVQGAEPDVIDGARGLIQTYGVDIIHMEFQPVLQLRHDRDPVKMLEMVYDLGYHCFECRFMRRAISPNRDFHNFTYNNFVTPFEPKLGLGVVGGITDMVCHSFAEAPEDRWRAKAAPYTVSRNNTRDYPKR